MSGPERFIVIGQQGPDDRQAGMSTCPMCGIEWLVTPRRDCVMPACGCYGFDATEANPDRPCERCGIQHAWTCEKRP